MSDNPQLQTSSPHELAGGVNNETRRGNEESGSTNSLAFGSSRYCKGENVEASSQTLNNKTSPTPNNSPRDLTSGFAVTGRHQENARAVDSNNLQGSNQGDHRSPSKDTAKSSLNRAADNGGPRQPRGQFPNGKRDSSLGSFSSDHADGSYPAPDGD